MKVIHLTIVSFYLFSSTYSMTTDEKAKLRETVEDMFHHAYSSYMTHAYPADELMPLSCKGRYRDVEPSRGDVDDILGNFSMTLIDSLDSLAIFGKIQEFEVGVKLVLDNVRFDNDIVVSVFETNIRVLGGLLGAHVSADVFKRAGTGMAWYNNELLRMAKDMGERLLPAFNTSTGIPYPRVNLKYGVTHPRSRTGTESDTCTACAGTMIMEFGALSRLTGDPIFEAAADKAMKALWTYRSRTSDLVGTVINIHNGEWVRRDSGVGAGIDSYYEYCLKAYILLGEEDYLQRFNKHYKAVMRYVNKGSLFLNVHMHNPTKLSYSYMDSLQAFWPGLQVLKGDLKAAIELHEVFYSVAKRHTFLPEAFTANFDVHWGQHLLRPELVESTYFLYEATKDPHYLDVGKYIVMTLNKYTRVPCGFAAVRDVRTLSHEDRMDSFLLSETLKYLYLLFTDKADLAIDIHDFVFTTEAHILPLGLSNWNRTSNQKTNFQSEHLHDHSCPSTIRDGNMMSFSEEVRRKSRSKQPDRCAKNDEDEASYVVPKTPSSPPLRAEQFIPGNADHLQILKSMGISVTKTDDGKVQLMQNAAVADTSDTAAEGIKFMQSIIALAKFRSEDGGAEHLPRVVQILSPPYNGHIVLNAGPAQFGIDLAKSEMGINAEVVLAEPFKGCTSLNNNDVVDHRIAVMERGECMFIDKVRQAQSCGAVAVIIIDDNEGSSSDSQPMFSMSGDGSSSGVDIPAVFLFSNEGEVLRKAMEVITRNTGGNLKVRIADKASKKVSKTDETLSTSEDLQSTEAVAESDNEQQEIDKSKTTSLDDGQSEGQTSGQPGTLENVGKKLNKVNKLIELMKNVANQHGFEYLTDDKMIKNKAAATEEGKLRNEGDITDGLLYDIMVAKLRADVKLEELLSRQKVAEKADLDAIKIIRKNDGEKLDGVDVARDSCMEGKISEARKTWQDFEEITKVEKATGRGKICVISRTLKSGAKSVLIVQDDLSTTETVISITNGGNKEMLEGGMNDQLLGGQTEIEDSDAESERIAKTTSDEELNAEGYSAKVVTGVVASDEEVNISYSDQQSESLEDLHLERSSEEVVTGVASGEEVNTRYSDPQSERVDDLHAEEVITGIASNEVVNTDYSDAQSEILDDLHVEGSVERVQVIGIPPDEELNTADDSQKETSNTFSSRHESRTSASLQASQEIETSANSDEVENDGHGHVSEKRDHMDIGDTHVTTPIEPRDAEANIGGTSPPDSGPSGEEDLASERGRFLADEL